MTIEHARRPGSSSGHRGPNRLRLTRPALWQQAAAAALALAALLVAGAPILDGVLDHGSGRDRPIVVHLDRPGGCGAHAEHCVLGTSGGGERQAPAARVPLPSAFGDLHARPALGTASLHTFKTAHRHSRAPPVASI